MKKRIIAALVAMTLICLSGCSLDFLSDTSSGESGDPKSPTSSAAADGSMAGSGSAEEPYEIATAKQLDDIRNDMSAHYIITSDIDLSEYGSWVPIGDMLHPFTGSLDGQGHTISGLMIDNASFNSWSIRSRENKTDDTNLPDLGLFGTLDVSAKVANVVFKDCSVKVSQWGASMSVGIITGAIRYNQPSTAQGPIISNCSTSGTIQISVKENNAYFEDMLYVGGICGNSVSIAMPYSITGCSNTAEISVVNTQPVHCGGIVGAWTAAAGDGALKGTITRCKNEGTITVSGETAVYSGGIVGYGNPGVQDCENWGNISNTLTSQYNYVDASRAGGIAGYSEGTFSNCTNYGNVQSEIHGGPDVAAGGINGSGFCDIENCVNYGAQITAMMHLRDGSVSYSDNVGRICALDSNTNLVGNSSDSGTLLNGATPAEYIGADQKNGANN